MWPSVGRLPRALASVLMLRQVSPADVAAPPSNTAGNVRRGRPSLLARIPRPDDPGMLRIGILGAARIAPTALVKPARTDRRAVVVAVAARDRTRAEKFARKHQIPACSRTTPNS